MTETRKNLTHTDIFTDSQIHRCADMKMQTDTDRQICVKGTG